MELDRFELFWELSNQARDEGRTVDAQYFLQKALNEKGWTMDDMHQYVKDEKAKLEQTA